MINYFVSSTFRDMQAERDALQNFVLPEIRKYANIRGLDVFLTDLRWGIDTSNFDVHESLKKIMSICMSEIDHCHPHMIILLGDRYGSTLDADTFETFINSPQGISFSAEDKAKSITEMEIIHGLFHIPNDGNFTICIRNSLKKEEIGDEMIPVYFEIEAANAEKLSLLKKILIEKYPQNVMRYSVKWDKVSGTITGLEEFISKLTHRLYSQVKSIISEPLTPEIAQQNADALAIATKSRTFTGRKSYLQDIDEFMKTSKYNCLIITGSSGIGKSCLMAKIATTYSKTHSEVVIFCENSPYIISHLHIMHTIIYRLCRILKIDYSKYVKSNSVFTLKETAETLIQQINSDLLIVIDALDAIVSENDIINFLPDMPSSSKCKILVSINSNIKVRFLHNNIRTIKLDILENEELSEMINSQLQALRKELPSSSKNLLLKKVVYHTPLYASMIFHRISSLNQSDFRKISDTPVKAGEEAKALYNYIEDELNNLPDQESELCIYLTEFFNGNVHFQFKHIVLQILCAFPNGLRNEDIIGIAQKLGEHISMLDLQTYFHYMSSMIYTTQNNRIHFLHKIILKALTNRFSGSISLIYKASLLYFKELVDDDSMKMSDFIRIAYCCKDYGAIAEYLSSLYLMEENLYFSGKTHINLIETAMLSLRKVFAEIPDENTALNFITTVINSISEQSPKELYGLCCAFLFSFDVFFEQLGICGKVENIMSLINDKCVRVLYPYRKKNPLYLRAIYVSYEQLGIRTTNYETRFNAYSLFHHHCLEMFTMMSEHSLTLDIDVDVINDLSISYSKLGNLYNKRDWRKAIFFYEKAVAITKLPCKNDSKKHLLINSMHLACREEAACIIQEAIQNNMIGWTIDDEMRELLNKSRDRLLVAIEYYNARNSTEYEYKDIDLAYCYMHLADWARATSLTEFELNYTKQMIEHAETAYRRNHDVLMYDLIRNGEFRLVHLSTTEKEKHLEKAFLMATEVREELDGEKSQEILHFCGGELLLNYVSKLERLFYDIKHNTDAISEICLETLRKFKPIVNLLIIGDDREKHYNAIINIFQKTLENIATQRHLAIQALSRNCYLAYRKSLFAYKLLIEMEDQINSKRWLRQMLDVSYLLSVCSHNARVQSYQDNTYDSAENEYLVTEMSANVKMYFAILCYEMLFPEDNFIKKYKGFFNECLGSYQCALYGLIEFVAQNIANPSREERFWEFIDRINYRIPNNRTVYFDIFRDEKIKKLSDKYISIIENYLYNNFQKERVQKLLYFSLLFEDITLEYAYKIMDYETVQKIIENGYDRYLELSTLYIIRKHDRNEFYKRAKELKFICLKNHRKLIKHDHMLSMITGSLFVSEADDLFKEILATSELTEPNDPRMHSERSVFKFSCN